MKGFWRWNIPRRQETNRISISITKRRQNQTYSWPLCWIYFRIWWRNICRRIQKQRLCNLPNRRIQRVWQEIYQEIIRWFRLKQTDTNLGNSQHWWNLLLKNWVNQKFWYQISSWDAWLPRAMNSVQAQLRVL